MCTFPIASQCIQFFKFFLIEGTQQGLDESIGGVLGMARNIDFHLDIVESSASSSQGSFFVSELYQRRIIDQFKYSFNIRDQAALSYVDLGAPVLDSVRPGSNIYEI